MGHVQVSHKPRPLTKVLFASLINELKFSLGLINVEGLARRLLQQCAISESFPT